MGSQQELDLVHPPRLDTAPPMVFHGDVGGGGGGLPFSRPQPPDLFFRDEFRRSVFDSVGPPPPTLPAEQQRREWNGEGSNGTTPDDVGVEDEDEDDEEEGDEGDGEVEGLVVGVEHGGKNCPNSNNSSGSVQSSSEKMRGEQAANSQKHHHSFGSSRVLDKDSNIVHPGNNIKGVLHEQQHQQGRMGHYDNAISLSDQDMYYAQMLQNTDGSLLAQKETGGENGCGFRGRKDAAFYVESGECLKVILSDPITGILMDDAMILPCGHSFGNNGLQHILKMKSCYTCGHSVKEESVSPNLALRSAVQSFRKEEELQCSSRCPKRRKDRCDQENGSYGDAYPVDSSRGKGVQFPFVVTDRVVIKGNKRTPQQFVGREAVVTTQCLNGWYVVKTLDNAESVKLQYRSLAKVIDNPSSNGIPSKTISSNWLLGSDVHGN